MRDQVRSLRSLSCQACSRTLHGKGWGPSVAASLA